MDSSRGGIRVDNWRSEAQASSGVTIAGFNSTETSRNISAMLTGKYGISPYVRWEKGFREPSIGDRVKAPIIGGGGNNIFEPESANDIEFGVKVQEKFRRSQFSGSVTYFHNHITNFYAGDAAFRVQAGPVATNALFAPEETVAAQQQPPPPPTQLNQVVLRGVESSFQMSIPLSTYGSISPSGTMNWLHGTNLTPIASQLAIIRPSTTGLTRR
jgi:outer membrane receptor protein involved in Fe transport